MDEYQNRRHNHPTEDDQRQTGTAQTSYAVIDTQPTYVQEGYPGNRRTIPFTTTHHSSAREEFPAFHRMGIDILGITDEIYIQQTVELLDLVATVESENRYLIKIPRGDTIYEVAEKSSSWQRAIMGSGRSYLLKVFDRSRREILRVNRMAACSCCLMYCCCFQAVQVYATPSRLLGSITQEWTMFVPTFTVKNQVGDSIYKIEGPSRYLFCVKMEDTFKILTYDGTREVGWISNQWNDVQAQHNLNVMFPQDETPDMRAVLLGAAFLVQYMFFEKSKRATRFRLSRFTIRT